MFSAYHPVLSVSSFWLHRLYGDQEIDLASKSRGVIGLTVHPDDHSSIGK